MRDVQKVLGPRILIRKMSHDKKIGDILIEDDGQSLPLAEVVLLSEEVKSSKTNQIEVGDIIHYSENRETGKCSHKGETHYIIPVGNATAIL